MIKKLFATFIIITLLAIGLNPQIQALVTTENNPSAEYVYQDGSEYDDNYNEDDSYDESGDYYDDSYDDSGGYDESDEYDDNDSYDESDEYDNGDSDNESDEYDNGDSNGESDEYDNSDSNSNIDSNEYEDSESDNESDEYDNGESYDDSDEYDSGDSQDDSDEYSYEDGDGGSDEYDDGAETPNNIFEVDSNGNIDLSQHENVEERALYERVFKLAQSIMPKEFVETHLAQMEFYNQNDGTGAYVYPIDSSNTKWGMAVNLDGVMIDGQFDTQETAHTLIHEFAHILTLNNSQIVAPTEANRDQAEASCKTTWLSEGCATDSAYIQAFHQAYWKAYRAQLDALNAQSSSDEEQVEFDANAYERHEHNKGEFVSMYAATNPAEDIAETFATFVTAEKPTGDTIADQKVNSFYEYAELVTLRTQIRTNLGLEK